MSNTIATIEEVEGESNDCGGCCFHTPCEFDDCVQDVVLGDTRNCDNIIFKIEKVSG